MPGEKYEGPVQYFALARKQGKFFPLGKMKMSGGGLLERKLVIDLESESQNVLVRITLDFVNERLLFDPLRDVVFRQDRNSRASVQEELAVHVFLCCMYCKSHLSLPSFETSRSIGYQRRFTPLKYSAYKSSYKEATPEV